MHRSLPVQFPFRPGTRSSTTVQSNPFVVIKNKLPGTIPADYLLEGRIDEVAQAKLEDKDLLQLFKDIESFQEEDKKIIKRLIEAFVSMKKIQQLAKV